MEPFCFSLQISSCMLIVSSLITTVPPYIDIAPSTGRFGAVPNKGPQDPFHINGQPVRLAGSYRCWFMKKYCWLVCVREKYYSG
ncbi:uncharacterized protein [Miscanthus floridulus]|uniref:uncharacterized protein isoform X4 n=1 Tax=Miscanthus floridulus TaxID=154761 RepID=UPI00345B42FC